MGIDHCCAHVLVAKKLLNCANIITILEKMCRERMAECVTRAWLSDSGAPNGLFDRFLQSAFMDMMTPKETRAWVKGQFAGRKDILPAKLPPRIWILLPKRLRQIDLAAPERP